jgi:hypothetical protein
LKQGKGAAFDKGRLRRLRQEDATWEADFRALPKPSGPTEAHYLGLVVALPRGNPLAYLPVEYSPHVNDLADHLAEAMRRPLTASTHRPQHLHLRRNPRWEELVPHLKELGITGSLQDDLPKLEEVHEDFLRQMRQAGSGPRVVFLPGPPPVAEQFPAIAQWVRDGHIEVGDQEGVGFVVLALDYGGLVFEDDTATTLAEALTALEKGLTEWYKEQGMEPS